jgi:hypothetical protein
VPVQHGFISILIRRGQMSSADQHSAVGELFEGKFAAAQDDHRIDEMRHAGGDHQHRRDGLNRHRFAKISGNAPGPRAGRIDQHRRRVGIGADVDTPQPILLSNVGRRHTLTNSCPERGGLAAERGGGSGGIRRAIAPRHHATRAALGHRWH